MSGLRDALQSKAGKSTAIILVILAGGLVFYSLHQNMGGSDAASISRDRMFVDNATGKAFPYELQIGDHWPIKAPSGGNTGYPGEPCYWTADGHAKTDPDWVILSSTLGQSGPTFCPVCGRLVVQHNPQPQDGRRPPPTKDQYFSSR